VINGVPETWSIGFLIDVILTRDPWMHRLDLARAIGQTAVLTADHDGVIVADIAAEWAPPARPVVPTGAHWPFRRQLELWQRW
jgi:hypothetical protein